MQYCSALPYTAARTGIWPPRRYRHGPAGTVRPSSSCVQESAIARGTLSPISFLLDFRDHVEIYTYAETDLLYPTASTALNFQSNELSKAKSLNNSKHLLRDKTVSIFGMFFCSMASVSCL